MKIVMINTRAELNETIIGQRLINLEIVEGVDTGSGCRLWKRADIDKTWRRELCVLAYQETEDRHKSV